MGWTLDITETSNTVFQVVIRDCHGISSSRRGTEVNQMIEQCVKEVHGMASSFNNESRNGR